MEINKSFQISKNKLRSIHDNTERITISIEDKKIKQNNVIKKLQANNLYQNRDNLFDFTTEWKNLEFFDVNLSNNLPVDLFASWELEIRGISHLDLVGLNFEFNFRFASNSEFNIDETTEIRSVDYILPSSSALPLESQKDFTVFIGIHLHDPDISAIRGLTESQNGIQVRLLANLTNTKKYY